MKKIDIYGDGSCFNKVGFLSSMGVGIVIKIDGITYKRISRFIGYGTSNIAEWSALTMALIEMYLFSKKDVCRFTYTTDSQLIVNQFNGVYSNNCFADYYDRAKIIYDNIHYLQSSVIVSWVPREKNKEADFLSKLGNPNKYLVKD